MTSRRIAIGQTNVGLRRLALPHCKISFALSQPTDRAAFPCAFPAKAKSFPCSNPKIPCAGEQGKFRQDPESITEFMGAFHKLPEKISNTLQISLIAGNPASETGSPLTVSSARESGLQGIISRCVRIHDIPAG
jgi:hypothetical protein